MRTLVVVAHPDDETIWAGGTILRHPDWEWTIFSLCRADDPDRAPRFRAAAAEFGALGLMSDLDDSPVPALLSDTLEEITGRILKCLPSRHFDLILTHGERGEYTRHERHEQTHTAVSDLVARGCLTGRSVFFAYEDGGRAYPPRPASSADLLIRLSPEEAERKRRIVSSIYGFEPGSFEYSACGAVEAFRSFERADPAAALSPLEESKSKEGERVAHLSNV